jgi:hypothetical protein
MLSVEQSTRQKRLKAHAFPQSSHRSAESVLAHIERLIVIRDIGLPPDIGRDVPRTRVSRRGCDVSVPGSRHFQAVIIN